MAEQLRVLHIVAGMNCGGIENFIMNVYRNLDRQKIQFDFLYHTDAVCFFDDEIYSLGGRIFRYPMDTNVRFLPYFRFLKQFFSRHTEFAVIHGHYSLFGAFYNHYARVSGVPVRIGHSHTAAPVGSGLSKLADCIFTPLFRYGLTDRFACSQQAGLYMFGRQPFTILPNGINVKQFRYSGRARKSVREQYCIDDATFVIGCVGCFRPEKNHLWFLDLFAEYLQKKSAQSTVLLMIGDGENRSSIECLIANRGLKSHIILAGQQPAAPFYSAMDLFVLPSLFEGLGIAAIEAQANGLPCLLSKGVPQEAVLNQNVKRLSLDVDRPTWLQSLYAPPSRIENGEASVRQAGFDISQTARALEQFYMKQAYRRAIT